MRTLTIISIIAFLTLSCQSTKDFSNPKSLVETFIEAATNKDKKTLSKCFSAGSPGEWDDIRNKTTSSEELNKLKEFVANAVIANVQMEGENAAIVFVKFKARDEKIHVVQDDDRWFILDF